MTITAHGEKQKRLRKSNQEEVMFRELIDDGVFRYQTLKAILDNYKKSHVVWYLKMALFLSLFANFLQRSNFRIEVLVITLLLGLVTGFAVKVNAAHNAFKEYASRRAAPEDTNPPDYVSGDFIVNLQLNMPR
jgi:hypothetical protein